MDKLDLTYGNPAFLQEYWKTRKEYIEVYRIPRLEQTEIMSYQIDPIPELVQAIKELHEQHNNAYEVQKHILIGNGATQVLTAIFHALDIPIYANPPYYQRFPILSHLAQVLWIKQPTSLQIITNPNNPDSSITQFEETSKSLYDLSYNWKTYTNPIEYDKDIMVFSLSKALGFASTRIGWALISDKKLYEKAKHYIEMTTSGISIEAQHLAYKAIKYTNNAEYKIFDYGRTILDFRWKELNKLQLPFEIINNSGMFALCKGVCPENIKCIYGTTIGLDSDKYFRLNIGCNDEDFNKLLCSIPIKKA